MGAAAGLVLSACHANGTTHTVTTTADTVDSNPGDGFCADAGGNCSLRAAIMEANAVPGVEEIQLADGATYILSIPGTAEDAAATGDLDITEGVVLVGDATIDGNGIDRVLDTHHAAGLVEIDGPTLRGGDASDGAALRVSGGGATSLEAATVRNNTGDAITTTAGTTFVWSSTIHANSGAATAVTGGTVNIQNATITGNGGPGVAVDGGTAEIVHATITNNAPGIDVASGTASVRGSIVAFQANSIDCTGAVTSGGHNLEQTTTCGFTAAGDLQNSVTNLGPLTDNGGSVRTRLPGPTSPAIDAATASACTIFDLDARDLARPAGAACDIGAVETQPAAGDCNPPDLTPGANLRFCDLSGFNLAVTDLSGADLTGADLSNATLILTDFTGATLDGATLDGAVLIDTNLTNVSADQTTFLGADLLNTTLTGADLGGSDLRGVLSAQISTTPAALPTGVVIGAQRIIGPEIDLSGADLSGADLSTADLAGANLTGATLTGATVTGTSFLGAILDGTLANQLIGTPASLPAATTLENGWIIGPAVRLTGADLSGRDYSGRSFVGTDFDTADLTNTVFTGADFSFATFNGTTLSGVDLSSVNLFRLRGLSVVGTPTLPPGWEVDRSVVWGPNVDLTGLNRPNGVFRLTGTDLSGALIARVEANLELTDVTAIGTDFSELGIGALPYGFTAQNSDFTGASWAGSLIRGLGFRVAGSDLTNTDFTGITMQTARHALVSNELNGADFTGSTLANLDGINNTGTPINLPPSHTYTNGWLHGVSPVISVEGGNGFVPDLSGVDLSDDGIPSLSLDEIIAVGTDFTDAASLSLANGDFGNADFTRARLTQIRDSDIDGANFQDAAILGANSSFAFVSRNVTGTPVNLPFGYQLIGGVIAGPSTWIPAVDLSGQNLAGIDLTRSRLIQTDLSNAVLALADFRGGVISRVDFTDANLFGAFIDGVNFFSTTWSNTVCPDGTNSDTNGDNSCEGHDRTDLHNIVGDPSGTPVNVSFITIPLGGDIVKPTLSYVRGATILEGPGLGVDWYINGVLFRDDDEVAPFNLGSAPTLETGVTFSGQGANGSSNTFFLGPGMHRITAVAQTTAGVATYGGTFRVTPS